jgi:FeS assembly SUF system protein
MNEMAFTDSISGENPEGVAFAGEPLAAGIPPATEDAIVEALKTVYDPEIPVDIYQLGLIYGLKVNPENGDVDITMTLTAPSCPVAGALPQQVANTVSLVKGTGNVQVALVWEPPWTMANMSEDARLALNLY